jgi:hypothetical protein
MEQHDQLTGWRPGSEGVEDQPTCRDLERLDHLARVAGAVGLPVDQNIAGAQQGEPLAAERGWRPQGWMGVAWPLLWRLLTMRSNRRDRDVLFGVAVVGSRRHSAWGPAASLAVAAGL